MMAAEEDRSVFRKNNVAQLREQLITKIPVAGPLSQPIGQHKRSECSLTPSDGLSLPPRKVSLPTTPERPAIPPKPSFLTRAKTEQTLVPPQPPPRPPPPVRQIVAELSPSGSSSSIASCSSETLEEEEESDDVVMSTPQRQLTITDDDDWDADELPTPTDEHSDAFTTSRHDRNSCAFREKLHQIVLSQLKSGGTVAAQDIRTRRVSLSKNRGRTMNEILCFKLNEPMATLRTTRRRPAYSLAIPSTSTAVSPTNTNDGTDERPLRPNTFADTERRPHSDQQMNGRRASFPCTSAAPAARSAPDLRPDSGYNSFPGDRRISNNSSISEEGESVMLEKTVTDKQESPQEKRIRKLRMAAGEIYLTEEAYVDLLHKLGNVYPEYLRASSEQMEKRIYDGDVVGNLSKLIDNILPTHKRLKEELNDHLQRWDDESPNVACVLKRFAPFLLASKEFLKQKDAMTETLITAAKQYPEFGHCTQLFERDILQGLKAVQQLDSVHQRLMRYPMLLANYLKYLPEGSAEIQVTQDAIIKCDETLQKLSLAVHQSEIEKKLWEAYKKLQGRFEVIAHNRQLLMEGYILKQSRKEPQRRYLMLFNDFLLYCRQSALENRFEIAKKIPLNASCTVWADDNPDFKRHFYVSSKQGSLRFIAESIPLRDEWVSLISKAIQKNIGDSRRKSAAAIVPVSEVSGGGSATEEVELWGSRPPVWVPDVHVTMCQIIDCYRPFTFISRRHHCRACGLCICGSCSARAPLAFQGLQPGIVCPKCFDAISQQIHLMKVKAGELVKQQTEDVNKWAWRFVNGTEDWRKLFKAPEVRVAVHRPATEQQNGTANGALPSSSTASEEREETPSGIEAEGYLSYLKHGVRKAQWVRVWAKLKHKMALEFYRAPNDTKCVQSQPLFGCQMRAVVKDDIGDWVQFEIVHRNQIRVDSDDGSATADVLFTIRINRSDSGSGDNIRRWMSAFEAAFEHVRRLQGDEQPPVC